MINEKISIDDIIDAFWLPVSTSEEYLYRIVKEWEDLGFSRQEFLRAISNEIFNPIEALKTYKNENSSRD